MSVLDYISVEIVRRGIRRQERRGIHIDGEVATCEYQMTPPRRREKKLKSIPRKRQLIMVKLMLFER